MSLPDRIQRGDYYIYTFDGRGLVKAPPPQAWRIPVEVQTVADYVQAVDAEMDQALVGLVLTPPYDHTAFYWEQELTDPESGRKVPGQLCSDITVQTYEQAREEVVYRRSVASAALHTPITVPDELEKFLDRHEDARWVLHGSLIVATPGRLATHIPFGLNIALDEAGRYLGHSGEWLVEAPSPEAYEGWQDAVRKAVQVALNSCAFLHVRHSELVEQPVSRQVRRAAARKGKPLLRHHRLVVKPLEEHMRRVREHVASRPGAKSLHMVRGHFATYTEDAPLLGKFVGTVWRAPHWRGDKHEGVVTKDYVVDIEGQG